MSSFLPTNSPFPPPRDNFGLLPPVRITPTVAAVVAVEAEDVSVLTDLDVEETEAGRASQDRNRVGMSDYRKRGIASFTSGQWMTCCRYSIVSNKKKTIVIISSAKKTLVAGTSTSLPTFPFHCLPRFLPRSLAWFSQHLRHSLVLSRPLSPAEIQSIYTQLGPTLVSTIFWDSAPGPTHYSVQSHAQRRHQDQSSKSHVHVQLNQAAHHHAHTARIQTAQLQPDRVHELNSDSSDDYLLSDTDLFSDDARETLSVIRLAALVFYFPQRQPAWRNCNSHYLPGKPLFCADGLERSVLYGTHSDARV